MALKFIDLFAGIGGFRIGMERAGFECVFSSEVDDNACEVYKENFGEDPMNDITELDVSKIPDFDVLCAGFPCQAFSISGRKKGFYDETRGTLFFHICRVLEEKKPSFFILENVKNLAVHDKGRTLNIMLDSLGKLGYIVNYRVLNAKDFGVPQNRERIVIVGNRINKFFDFDRISMNPIDSMKDFLDENGDFEFLQPNEYTLLDESQIKTQSKSKLKFIGYRNKKMRSKGVRPGTEHLSRVHKQPNRIYSIDGVHPTLPSQETSGRFFIYNGEYVRKLTINECYRFMGFPEDFKRIGPTGQQYLRIGNSICINMVEEVGKVISNILLKRDDILNRNEVREELEKYYVKSQQTSLESLTNEYKLNDNQTKWVNQIVEKEATFKGVYTVLLSSLIYKHFNPKQDIRYHQKELENGYSGRSFDTKYVTPFLKEKRFRGAMKESGWLTRSLEQKHPYDLNYPGQINNKSVKNSFLNIINDVEKNDLDPKKYIYNIIKRSMIEKEKQNVVLINPIKSESQLDIKEIIELLKNHFSYKYSSRGASILPVIAFYSIYECLINEMDRYKGKTLGALESHYSSDKSSGASGDIIIYDENNEQYEVVEVKYNINIDDAIIEDAYNKIKPMNIQRYYILSTYEPNENDKKIFIEKAKEIRKEHGCQLIVNGLMKTLEYYLRLLSDTDEFVENYMVNLKEHPEINYEHQVSWNTIIKNSALSRAGK